MSVCGVLLWQVTTLGSQNKESKHPTSINDEAWHPA